MNAQAAQTVIDATLTDAQHELAARIERIRYYDIAALCREVKGGTLGFDFNRKFSGAGSKLRFAQWAVSNLDNAALIAALPTHEAAAQAYYSTNKPKAAKAVQSKPAPAAPQVVPAPPIPVVQVNPVPVEPTAPQAEPNSALILAAIRDAVAQARELDKQSAMQVKAWALAEIEHAMQSARPLLVTVNNNGAIQSNMIGRQHMDFDKLLKLCAVRRKGTGLNIWMTGPAGSGKTTAAENCAKALGIPFKFTGAIDNEFKLLGFIDASGKCVRTAFREAYEHGGVFLLDEVDGCHPAALLALNAALANGYCDFPDGAVMRHADCVIIAAANTWGQGATHEYVGRAKLDAASLDRFVMMPWQYDEALERDTCGRPQWAQWVQAVRAKALSVGEKVIISPRASYDGAALLMQGFTRDEVAALVVRKGISEAVWAKISVPMPAHV